MIHEHWTSHLPESDRRTAGTIEDWGRKQMYRLMRIAELQKQIRDIRAEMADEERSLEAAALNAGWTAEEIAEAQANARDHESRRAYLDAMANAGNRNPIP